MHDLALLTPSCHLNMSIELTVGGRKREFLKQDAQFHHPGPHTSPPKSSRSDDPLRRITEAIKPSTSQLVSDSNNGLVYNTLLKILTPTPPFVANVGPAQSDVGLVLPLTFG